MKENRKTYFRLLFLWNLLILLPYSLQAKSEEGKCPLVNIVPERLADLNIPRSGHSAFFANGEVTVVGGHTSGFVLTPTAEYYKDGEWHLLKTVYPHDGGFYVALHSGKVLVAGGFKENLGIGQSFEVEMYDPTSHTFTGFGCLDKKRASATAVELDSGKVLIAGNWYANDGIELFNGQEVFSHLKTIQQSRYLPHLFKTSNGNVLIVAGYDSKGQPIERPIIERMKGEAFSAPLLETWRPLQYDLPLHSDDCFIGDTSRGIYTYLMPVQDMSGQMAIAEVCDTVFSILPTECPVPMAGKWGKITYYTPVFADRQHQRGYVMGSDSFGRQYALCIDYAKKPAKLTLYHTDPLTDGLTLTIPVMTGDGNLLLTGVKTVTKPNFNFSPTSQVWLLRFNDESIAMTNADTNRWPLGILTVVSVAILIALGAVVFKRRRQPQPSTEANERIEQSPEAVSTKDEELMQRIYLLIEKEKPYLSSELKVSDIAKKLNTSSRNISDCIKNSTNNTFVNFINAYRIDFAKQLMRQQPNIKISEVFLSSGFANETTFFRIFKAVTGMTPNEWKTNGQA